jgi:hypothetical protein
MFVAAIVTLTAVTGYAQLSGPLSGTLGPGSYTVAGDCWVEGGDILTIQPGTTLLFAGNYNIVVNAYGELQAVGTELDSIVFTRQDPYPSCDWGGIRFAYGASSSSIFSYCVLEYARYHPTPNVNGGALYLQSSGITITHCTIANNSAQSGGGIYINTSSVTISNCVFANNYASQNGGGLQLKWSSNISVNNCVFVNNSSHGT